MAKHQIDTSVSHRTSEHLVNVVSSRRRANRTRFIDLESCSFGINERLH
jgi:hypothetical protein